MILIVGKYESLMDSIAAKFRDMKLGGDVQVRNTIRLLDFLNAHHQEIEVLVYADKPQSGTAESPSRLELLQLLWTVATKKAIPPILLFGKYKSDYTVDNQLDRFTIWTEKQYKNPPFHYIFKLGELYGLKDRSSMVDRFYRQIVETGSVDILRQSVGEGEPVEREMDYVYIRDVLRVLYWFVVHRPESGVYELGSGFPRTDTAVASAVFRALKRTPQINYADDRMAKVPSAMPVLHTDLSHLRHIGYRKPFCPVESGVKSYLHQGHGMDDGF